MCLCRHGTCTEISGDYELTSTPGRFFYRIASMCLPLSYLAAMPLSSQFMLPLKVLQVLISFLVLSTEWDVNVDAYVVRANYTEYALMIMSKQRPSRENSISIKLYSEWTLSIDALEHFIILFVYLLIVVFVLLFVSTISALIVEQTRKSKQCIFLFLACIIFDILSIRFHLFNSGITLISLKGAILV